MKARELFLTLERDANAPGDNFERFVVGNVVDDSLNKLKDFAIKMAKNEDPSRLQLITGENGNGKTLLANRFKKFLGDENIPEIVPRTGQPESQFIYMYSYISALGKASSQTSLEIVSNLRRSEFEGPEITYSLIAVEIIKNFERTYQAPWLFRFAKILLKAAVDVGMLGAATALEDSLRDKSAGKIKSALDSLYVDFQRKFLSRKHYRESFNSYIGDIIGFEPFVKTYFGDSREAGVDELRNRFLNEVNKSPSLAQIKQVVDSIVHLSARLGAKLIVIIIDDCNQLSLADQLLPLIDELHKYKTIRVLLIINMVQNVADEIERQIRGRNSATRGADVSLARRLFHTDPIRLSRPDRRDVAALYDRLRTLRNEAYSDGHLIPDRDDLRDKALDAWELAKTNGEIYPNFSDAVQFLIQRLRAAV